jgi:hypothetical protein
MLSNREGQSTFLDNLVKALTKEEHKGLTKTAASLVNSVPVDAEPVEKLEADKVASGTHPIEKAATEKAVMEKAAAEKLTLHQVRIARREGRFVKVAGRNDLYQDAATNDFWKISDDKQYAVRSFDENNGLASGK